MSTYLDPATTACLAFESANHALHLARNAMWALEGRDGFDDVQKVMDLLVRIELRAQRKRVGDEPGKR